jgi:pimeloyl-ACP methyl ester carboxylesterase
MTAGRGARATAESPGEKPADGEAASGTLRTASLDAGREVAYAEYGAAEGTPVALLHGTPGSHVLGELYGEAARDRGVRLLAIDRPGYGGSTPWPSRTPTDASEYVGAVLDDAGVSRVGVVAFSGGSSHALAFAATCEERVTEVDIVSGAAPPSLRAETPAVIRLLGGLAERTPRLLSGLVRGQAWLAKRGPASVVVGQYTDDPDEVPDEAAEVVRRDFVAGVGDQRAGFVTESRLSVREWDVPLAAVERPVRLWHGGRDENAPVEGARRLADRLPEAGITVFEEADHLSALLRSRSAVLDRQSEAGSEAET